MSYRNLLTVVIAAFCATAQAGADAAAPCSDEWNRHVDEKIVSTDGQGHGPDLGSDEWKGVVEFKLGIRGQEGLPARDSGDWCRLIDRLVNDQ